MKTVFVAFLLCAMMVTLFAGCQAPYDPNVLYDEPLSEELKQEINNVLKINLDYVDYYYGSRVYGIINDCVIIRVDDGLDLELTDPTFEVAGYMFDWSGKFNFIVYHDGEICYLKEAYEKNWLTAKQIEVIHAKSHAAFANKIHLTTETDLYPNWGYDCDYLYRDPPTEQLKEEISSAFSAQYAIAVDWDYAYTFYGTINGCAILMIVDQKDERVHCTKKIIVSSSGREEPFEWLAPFELYAYRNGEVCTLQEAFDKEWLSRVYIEHIRQRNIQYYAELYHS